MFAQPIGGISHQAQPLSREDGPGGDGPGEELLLARPLGAVEVPCAHVVHTDPLSLLSAEQLGACVLLMRPLHALAQHVLDHSRGVVRQLDFQTAIIFPDERVLG